MGKANAKPGTNSPCLSWEEKPASAGRAQGPPLRRGRETTPPSPSQAPATPPLAGEDKRERALVHHSIAVGTSIARPPGFRNAQVRTDSFLTIFPLSGDLIRRFAPPVHLAVPEKCCGLTFFLAFFDRCGKSAIASSATGSAMALFPLRGEGFGRLNREESQLPCEALVIWLFLCYHKAIKEMRGTVPQEKPRRKQEWKWEKRSADCAMREG